MTMAKKKSNQKPESLESKIEKVVEIWVDKGSLSATARAKNEKYDEIMVKVLEGLYTEEDIDLFIHRSISGYYETERNSG